jgi:hypothetical protein
VSLAVMIASMKEDGVFRVENIIMQDDLQSPPADRWLIREQKKR